MSARFRATSGSPEPFIADAERFDLAARRLLHHHRAATVTETTTPSLLVQRGSDVEEPESALLSLAWPTPRLCCSRRKPGVRGLWPRRSLLGELANHTTARGCTRGHSEAGVPSAIRQGSRRPPARVVTPEFAAAGVSAADVTGRCFPR
jgi:hypothetical protein